MCIDGDREIGAGWGTRILSINRLKCFTQMAELSLKTGLGPGLLLFIFLLPAPPPQYFSFEKFQTYKIIERMLQ